jgi:hypothetical protein
MTRRLLCALAAGALAPAVVLGAPAQAASSYQYSFQEHRATDTSTDVGLCDSGPAEITLVYNEAFHVTSSLAGQSRDQVELALETNDPSISRVTFVQSGTFVVAEANGVTYTGHFASWFGGSVKPSTSVFTGIFNLNGTGTDGSRISFHDNAHQLSIGDQVALDFEKTHLNGCLTP